MLAFSAFERVGRIWFVGRTCLACLILISSPSIGGATISTTGDVSPAYPETSPDPWNLGAEVLQVGVQSNASLIIDAASDVMSTSSVAGVNSGTESVISVVGSGSSWSNNGDLSLGLSGNGSLNVLHGATAFNFDASLGQNSGGIGEVLVENDGSRWSTAGEMIIGEGGAGILTIRDKGQVIAGAAYVGRGMSANGSVVVAGAGSTWTVFGALILGDLEDGGTATLSLTEAGGRVYVGTAAELQGDLLPPGETAFILAESFGSAQVAIYGGNQVHNAGNAYIALGEGKMGMVKIDGATSAWNNDGSVSIGTGGLGMVSLIAGGTISAGGLITVGANGTLTGDGVADGDTVSSGRIAPGQSGGTLTIGGDYTQLPVGTLNIHLAGSTAGAFDTLAVSGQATLAGTLDVELGMNGAEIFAPAPGDSFEILTAASISGQFSDLLLPPLADGLTWHVETGLESVKLVVAAALPGDYNDDGTVDAADYSIWRDTFGSDIDLRADGDNSGSVTQLDYEIWKDNFGATIASARLSNRATVPEPGSAWLACALLSLLSILSPRFAAAS